MTAAALIVGGDYITAVKQTLNSFGIEQITHWAGRKPGDAKQSLPRDTDVVIMMTDWVNHSVADKVKRTAEKQGVQVVYARGNGGNLRAPLAKLAERGLLAA